MQEACTKWDSSLTGMFGLNGMARSGSQSFFCSVACFCKRMGMGCE